MPQRAENLHQRGILALRQDDFQGALDAIHQAIALAPSHAALYCNRGIAWQRLGNLALAIADYDQAIALDPSLALAHANRGVACMENGQSTEALASFARALALAPDHAATHSNWGNALLELNRADAALEHYDQALRIDPNHAVHHLHRGLACLQLDRFAPATDAFQQALGLDPGCATAYCYLGEVHRAQNRHTEARTCYTQALALEPDHADTQFFLSLSLLANSEWARGWPLYEWRWRSQAARLRPRQIDIPLWLGQVPLEGQRLLVHCEQGLGDTLQFCRYLPQLVQRGAQVVVEAPATLLPLLQTLAGDCEWVPTGATLPPLSLHCPLLSLPLALGAGAPAPMAPGGYLHVPETYQRKWAAKRPRGERRRLGIAWSGNPLHRNDRHRSLRLADLLPFLPTDWDLVVMQTEVPDADGPVLQAAPNCEQPGAAVQDFADSAALCASIDLLLTVDTSLAHLGGALGCPTWLLLPWRADWRWGVAGDRSDWYPGMRLYRQPALHDWHSVLARVRADLLSWECPAGPARHTQRSAGVADSRE